MVCSDDVPRNSEMSLYSALWHHHEQRLIALCLVISYIIRTQLLLLLLHCGILVSSFLWIPLKPSRWIASERVIAMSSLHQSILYSLEDSVSQSNRWPLHRRATERVHRRRVGFACVDHFYRRGHDYAWCGLAWHTVPRHGMGVVELVLSKGSSYVRLFNR